MMQRIGHTQRRTRSARMANTHPECLFLGVVCPTVCLTDWDKRKTPVASHCLEMTCDKRQSRQRRGQDSNLRTSYPVTDLANPRFRPLSHLSVAANNLVLLVLRLVFLPVASRTSGSLTPDLVL